MSTETDWRHELDRAIPAPPTAYAADATAAGRRALLRRRTGLGAAGLAAALVVGGAAWTLAPGSDSAAAPIATDPTSSTSTPSPDADTSAEATATTAPLAPMADRPEEVPVAGTDVVEDFAAPDAWPAAVLGNGRIVRKEGWRIEALYVLEATGPQDSLTRAWAVSAVPAGGGQARWMILDWTPDGSGMVGDRPGLRFSDFERWLDATWAAQQGLAAPGTASLGGVVDGRLQVRDGVTVLDQVEHPKQAAAYGPVEDLVAAEVELSDGRTVFLLAMPGDAVEVDPAVLDAPTMAAFLDHLQAQGASGEGLR